jgi:serine/threonine-protein kinase
MAPPSRAVAGAPLRVAVLRFRHEGADEDRYLTLGLSEAVGDELAALRSLRVRTSSRADEEDAAAQGRALGVDVVVVGSVEVDEERVRVAARAVGVEDGFLLGAARVCGLRGDATRMAASVASAVAEAVDRGRIDTRSVAGPSAEAVDLYLRGRWEYHRFWRKDEAASLLARAHALAGEDPRILAALALARSREVGLEIDTRQARAEAKACATRAAELAPQLADAHVAVGVTSLRDGDVESAAHSIRAAHDLDSGNVDALEQSARILLETRSAEEGIARAELAIRAEPVLQGTLPFQIVRAHALMGEWDVVDRTFATRPREQGPLTTYWLTRARLSVWREGTREAARVLAELAADPIPNATFPMAFARVPVEGVFGSTERAMLLERAQATKTSVRQRSFFAQVYAEVLCRLGELDAALQLVEGAVQDGLFDVLWLDGCPVLAPLRTRPGWPALRSAVAERAAKAAAILLARRSLLPTMGL